ANGAEVDRGDIRAKKIAGVGRHLAAGIPAEQGPEIHPQIEERQPRHHRQAEQQDEGQQRAFVHGRHRATTYTSSRRNPALSWSESITRARNTSRIAATSPPANIRRDRSSCWPKPPAPTNPMIREARIAHSQR